MFDFIIENTYILNLFTILLLLLLMILYLYLSIKFSKLQNLVQTKLNQLFFDIDSIDSRFKPDNNNINVNKIINNLNTIDAKITAIDRKLSIILEKFKGEKQQEEIFLHEDESNWLNKIVSIWNQLDKNFFEKINEIMTISRGEYKTLGDNSIFLLKNVARKEYIVLPQLGIPLITSELIDYAQWFEIVEGRSSGNVWEVLEPAIIDYNYSLKKKGKLKMK